MNKAENTKIIIFLVVAAIGVFLIFYSLGSDSEKEPSLENEFVSPIPRSSEPYVFANLSLTEPSTFIQINETESDISPSIPYSKVDISEIENISSFEAKGITLNEEQIKALEEDGFFLATNNITGTQEYGIDDFVHLYEALDGSSSIFKRNPADATFITSDYGLHLYHALVDKNLQEIEENTFQPMLREMMKTLFLHSINRYYSTDNEILEESYKKLSVFYLVPLIILDTGSGSSSESVNVEDYDSYIEYMSARDNQVLEESETKLIFSLDKKEYEGIALDNDVFNLTNEELSLINDAQGADYSPLTGLLNDYSQFKPRSHYTKNYILKSYFSAMTWLGRTSFPLKSEESMREALIITSQINNLNVGDEKLADLWSKMMETIGFFVGELDDLSAYEFTELMKDVYGENIEDTDFTDSELLTTFIERAKTELPDPKIVSGIYEEYDNGGERDELLAETKQFLFMGQRFTPDAYIINNLTQGIGSPEEETQQLLPFVPTALMPIYIIQPENNTVKDYLDEWVNSPERLRESDKIIEKVLNSLKEEFSNFDIQTWTKNIYWSWLDCFKSLLSDYGEGYPYFMQSDNWAKKNLGTVLGSFTELKHDTLLYSKQSYAELGGGPIDEEIPPVAKGYVEPDLTFWNKLITLSQATEQGLKDRGLLSTRFEKKYYQLNEAITFFKELSEKELKNEEISDDDFEKLRTINNKLYYVVRGEEDTIVPKSGRSALIADLHTDAVNGKVLYEATGKPLIIYVAVKDVNGTRLTRGAVFSHYEFVESSEERLSDEDWKSVVYDGEGELPSLDKWLTEIIK